MAQVHHLIDEEDDLIVYTKFGVSRFRKEKDEVRHARRKREKVRGQRRRAERCLKFARASRSNGAGA